MGVSCWNGVSPWKAGVKGAWFLTGPLPVEKGREATPPVLEKISVTPLPPGEVASSIGTENISPLGAGCCLDKNLGCSD